MISGYKVVLRTLLRQKKYALINITGLAIGMACAMLIFLWVQDELAFDKFHADADHIYRLGLYFPAQDRRIAVNRPPLAKTLQNEFPEIVNAVRYKQRSRLLVKYNDTALYQDGGAVADPSFFDLFSFTFKKGDPKTALLGPKNVVISQEMAQKYFPNEEPLNKILLIDDHPMQITGVIDNVPAQSHIQFSFISSISLLEQFGEELNDWGNCNVYTYIRLADHVADDEVIKKITDYTAKLTAMRYGATAQDVNELLYCQNLANIHQNSDVEAQDDMKIGDIQYVRIFIFTAIFILFIACVNYVNLATTQANLRKREVGIKKVLGSDKHRLVVQFFSESLLFSILSYTLAILLVTLILPAYNDLVDKNLHLSILNGPFITGSLLIVLTTAMLSGAYPAFYFSSFNPMQLFKNTSQRGAFSINFRKVLIIAQFLISIVLIIGTLVIHDQLHYIRKKKLGFDQDNVIYVKFRGEIGNNYTAFKNELKQDPNILGVSAKNSLPIESADYTDEISWPGMDRNRDYSIEATAVEWDYLPTMDIDLIKGRNFSNAYGSDQLSFILNEAAVQELSLTEPIGKPFSIWGYNGTIIGVTRNIHSQSLKHQVEPQLLYLLQDPASQEMADYGVILLRLRGGKIPQTLSFIENTWNTYNPAYPFEFEFLDKAVDHMYQLEQKVFSVFNYFTFLSIFIACLGLFGLVSFTTKQRVKELGIRKVLGASVSGIAFMLSKSIALLVLWATLVAWPVAYFIMNNWLQNFAYRVHMDWRVFVLAGIAALCIAMLTTSGLAIRAAMANPVKALKYE